MTQWESELTELATSRGGALVGYAYSLCRDRAQAEDLVQDALVKVFSRLRRLPGTADGGRQIVDLDQPRLTNAEAYVRRAILTIYLDGYRRQSSWSSFKHLLADDDWSPGADRVATARVDVGAALAQLSPRQREAVMLRFFEDLTVPQIAAALGTRPGTIKRYLSDAIELLRTALAEMATPELETSLDERLDAVAGAVRRRRTAKVGAVAGVSMVLAVALAWGAFAVKPWIRSEPLPADEKVEYTPGYVPVGWRATDGLYCGMPVEELEALDPGTYEVEITGDLTSVADGTTAHWEIPVTISRAVSNGLPEERDADAGLSITDPFIVWTHEGRVVDFVGRGWSMSNPEMQRTLSGAGTWRGMAGAENSTSCREDTLASDSYANYVNERPGARYDLRVAAVDMWVQDHSDGAIPLVISDPITVDLDSGVAPLPSFAPPSDDCSGAAYAGRDLMAQDLPEDTRDLAVELLAAVTSCDSHRVAELGKGTVTVPRFPWTTPSVNEIFALPETDGRTPYATVARLLTETKPVRDPSEPAWAWPRASRWVNDDEAWQEAIDAGVVTEEQAATDRAEGRYTGWRMLLYGSGESAQAGFWGGFYEGARD